MVTKSHEWQPQWCHRMLLKSLSMRAIRRSFLFFLCRAVSPTHTWCEPSGESDIPHHAAAAIPTARLLISSMAQDRKSACSPWRSIQQCSSAQHAQTVSCHGNLNTHLEYFHQIFQHVPVLQPQEGSSTAQSSASWVRNQRTVSVSSKGSLPVSIWLCPLRNEVVQDALTHCEMSGERTQNKGRLSQLSQAVKEFTKPVDQLRLHRQGHHGHYLWEIVVNWSWPQISENQLSCRDRWEVVYTAHQWRCTERFSQGIQQERRQLRTRWRSEFISRDQYRVLVHTHQNRVRHHITENGPTISGIELKEAKWWLHHAALCMVLLKALEQEEPISGGDETEL